MLDQGFADLVDEVAGPRSKDCQRAYEETVKAALDPYSRETGEHSAEAGGRRTASKTGKTVRRRTPAAAPGAATEMTTPEGEGARLGAKVSGRPSIGTEVAVPSETWPDYDCREMGGRAWQATVVSSTGLTAVVRFTHAKSAAGRAYADVRLPHAGLHLMA